MTVLLAVALALTSPTDGLCQRLDDGSVLCGSTAFAALVGATIDAREAAKIAASEVLALRSENAALASRLAQANAAFLDDVDRNTVRRIVLFIAAGGVVLAGVTTFALTLTDSPNKAILQGTGGVLLGTGLVLFAWAG